MFRFVRAGIAKRYAIRAFTTVEECESKLAAAQFLKKVDSMQVVDEVESVNQWKSKVMEQEVPVILDCYADWCKPCSKLTPLLEQKTKENDGKFKMVKLNIDNCN